MGSALAQRTTSWLDGPAGAATSASDLFLLPIRKSFGVAAMLARPVLSVVAAARTAFVHHAEEAMFPTYKTWIRSLAAAVVFLQTLRLMGIAHKPKASAVRTTVVSGLSLLLFRHALLLHRGHGEMRSVDLRELLGHYVAGQLGL